MHIENKIRKDQIGKISSQIYTLIREEKRLTSRLRRDIRKLLENGFFFLAFDNGHLIGFIARENIYKNYYELKSWLVVPGLRNKGVGTSLLKKATSEKDFKYLIMTFYDDVIGISKRQGFRITSFLKLSLPLTIKILLTRNPKSVIKHV